MTSFLTQAPLLPETPRLTVNIVPVTGRKTGSAQIKGATIEIRVPQRWPKKYQQQVAAQLGQRLQREFEKDVAMLQSFEGYRLSFSDKASLLAWIQTINRETIQAPLRDIRIGQSRYSRLAQMNIQTRIMTVSKFCLQDVPEPALRYLIIHELTHLEIPNHSRAFWNRVRQFVPDLNYQRKLINATHRMRIFEASLPQTHTSKPEIIREYPTTMLPPKKPSFSDFVKQLVLPFTGG